MRKFSLLIVLLLTGTIGYVVLAQCNSFSRRTCLPQLKDFINTGQPNIDMLFQGDTMTPAKITMSSGSQYRIVVCGQEVLGEVYFFVKDKNDKVVFNSKEHNNSKTWDFETKATEDYYIYVVSPPGKKRANDMQVSGCVSVVVGFKLNN